MTTKQKQTVDQLKKQGWTLIFNNLGDRPILQKAKLKVSINNNGTPLEI